MAVLTATVSNGGICYRPQLLKEIRSPDGQLVKRAEPEITDRLTIRPEIMALVHQGLHDVVNGEKGTARGSKFPGLNISGKTGTGQVVSRKDDEEEDESETPDHLKAHAWFVAYAPTEQPQIAVAVLVEHGEHGSGTAAPIAREMIKTYLLGDKLRPESLESKILANQDGT
jgi:penicillin-binding protein 2